MRLDDHIFEEVAMAMGAMEADQNELRRRRAVRYHVGGHVLIRPHGVANPVPREVELVNISAVGVCIVDRLTMSAGNQFVIYMPRAGGATIDVVCTVRQSRLSASGAFRVGAEFTSEMDANTRLVRGADGVMAAAVNANAQGDKEPGRPAQIRMVNEGPEGHLYPAEVREISAAAVNVVTGKSVGAGEQFVLQLPVGKGNRTRIQSLQCTVTHVRMLNSGQFRVSARVAKAERPAEERTGVGGWFRKIFG